MGDGRTDTSETIGTTAGTGTGGPIRLEVPLDWAPPTWGDKLVPAGGRVEESTEAPACAVRTEHDTVDADLARAGIVLTRDATGWTLTVEGTSARFPAVPSARAVPVELRDLLLGVRAGAALRPVRRITAVRTVHTFTDDAGAVVGEIADITEIVAPLGADAVEPSRHRRLEISGWDAAFPAVATRRLTKNGARAAAQPARPRVDTVGDAVARYLGRQHDAVLRADLDLRRGRDAVHRYRVAVRRLRSALRVVDVADPARTAALDAELRWLSAELGAARDLEVLREHLRDTVLELSARTAQHADPATGDPATSEFAEAWQAITAALDEDDAAARARLEVTLRGRRYLAVLRALRDWRLDAPFTADAQRPVGALARYVRTANRRLDKKLARAGASAEKLHSARKAAKRARYVAEFAGDAAGKHGPAVVARAKSLQTGLGDHQDCVLATRYLERVGARTTGRAAFDCGVLWAREQARAQDSLQRAVERQTRS